MANCLKSEKKRAVISLLVEGCSIRSIERVTGVHRDTICRLLVNVGEHCNNLLNDHIRGIYTSSIQVDELWCFVQKKQRKVLSDDPKEFGDAYTYLAIDRETKLIAGCDVGKRDEITTHRFIQSLAERIIGEVQIFTDGWGPYRTAIPRYFGDRAHFMQIVKNFDGNTDEEHRYSPPRVTSVSHNWVQGSPKARLTTTSHVERHNWTVRGALRRFTRLSNGFSRRVANLQAAVSLYCVWFNWCRKHATIKTTPAIATGIASEVWPIDRLIPN